MNGPRGQTAQAESAMIFVTLVLALLIALVAIDEEAASE